MVRMRGCLTWIYLLLGTPSRLSKFRDYKKVSLSVVLIASIPKHHVIDEICHLEIVQFIIICDMPWVISLHQYMNINMQYLVILWTNDCARGLLTRADRTRVLKHSRYNNFIENFMSRVPVKTMKTLRNTTCQDMIFIIWL